jgi:hypothetical protein
MRHWSVIPAQAGIQGWPVIFRLFAGTGHGHRPEFVLSLIEGAV